MNDTRKAVIYTRISKDSTGQGLGVARQLEDCRALAGQRGWHVVDMYQDNDVSASGKAKRPGFEAMLDALASGRADTVIAWNLDRLTRNRRDTVRLIETGQDAKATIALVRGSDLDLASASGRMVAEVLASVARNEIEVKGERQRRAVEQAVAAGKRVGGRRAFGYTLGMEPLEPEAQAVRDAYDMLLAGRSLGAIAREWSARGLVTPQSGNEWSGQVLSRTLRKATYAGLREHRPTDRDGKRLGAEIIGPAVWPGLVSEDVWRAAQGIMTNPARRSPGGAQALLTGVALCYACGSTVHAGGATRGYRMYRCSGSLGHLGRRAEPVDDYVSSVAIARLSRPDAVELLASADKPDLAALASEAHAKRARLDQLAEDYADGAIDRSQLQKGTARLRARLEEIDGQMTEAHANDALAPLVAAQDVAAAWADLSTDARREVVRTLMDVVILSPGRGTRTFRDETVITVPVRNGAE